MRFDLNPLNIPIYCSMGLGCMYQSFCRWKSTQRSTPGGHPATSNHLCAFLALDSELDSGEVKFPEIYTHGYQLLRSTELLPAALPDTAIANKHLFLISQKSVNPGNLVRYSATEDILQICLK